MSNLEIGIFEKYLEGSQDRMTKEARNFQAKLNSFYLGAQMSKHKPGIVEDWRCLHQLLPPILGDSPNNWT